MRKIFILIAIIEIILCIIILNQYPDSKYIEPFYYTISITIFMLTPILALTYYSEYCILKKIHSKMKYYIFTCTDHHDNERIVIKDIKTHKPIYNQVINYLDPNLIETLILQTPSYLMKDFIEFISEDFRIQIPKSCDDIPTFIQSYINQSYKNDKYIYDQHSDNWIKFIDIDNPQNTITFTKQESN